VRRPPTRPWRAWVWDGEAVEVYASDDTEWRDVPRLGVVAVVVYLDPPYRRIIDGHDWIWVEDGAFQVVDTDPEWGEWAAPPDRVNEPGCKRGSAVPDDVWAEIQQAAMEAREWPST
jgi:hypothetical protein